MPESNLTGEVLSIRQLAEYLMVSEKTVYRMLERNQLPAVRVGVQWRFRRQDIDDWISNEIRRVEYDGDRSVLGTLEAAQLAIHPLLSPANVWLKLRPRTREELLAVMISEATLDEGTDRASLLRSVREREALCSTAMIEHAAFPHPLDPRPFRFSRKRILLAALQEPLDYLDPHGHRPRIVALILARSMQGHLLALGRAIKLFGEATLIDEVTAAASAEAVMDRIASAEARLAEAKLDVQK